MANYDVSIKLAIAGAKELDRVNKQTERLRTSINAVNKTAEFSGKKPVKNFNNLSKSVREAREALDEAAIGTKEFNQAVKNLVQVEAKFDRQMKQRERRLKIQRLAQKEGISFSKAKILLAKQEAEAEAKLAAAKTKTAQADLRKRVGGTISSAAIGGAFPLLFGQTGAAAIGGGLGGLAGGAIGGQFGFALSIVGTALGAAVDKNQKFNESLAVLNARLSVVGDGSKLVAKDIDDLARRFRITKEEAFGLLEGFKEFDNPRLRKSLVEVFGSDSGAFQGLASSNRSAKLANEIFEARKLIGDQQATQLLQQNLINGAEVIELALIRAKIKARQRDQIEQAKQVSLFRRIGAGFQLKETADVIDERIKKLEKTFAETEDQTIKDTVEGLKIIREQIALVNEAQGQFGQSGVLSFTAVTDKVKDLQDEMKKLTNPIFQVITLSETMAKSFEDSFVGIIRGTMSVGDAFRNMLNLIADEFIRNAARMAANQFQQGLLGFLGQGLTAGVGGSALKFGVGNLGINKSSDFLGVINSPKLPSSPSLPLTPGLPSTPSLPITPSLPRTPGLPKVPRFADGGRPLVGRASIVGERGPELFVPDRAGTIIPNNAMGGAMNVIVNVDASGSSVEGDEQQGRELGRVISAAVQSELIQQKRPGGFLA